MTRSGVRLLLALVLAAMPPVAATGAEIPLNSPAKWVVEQRGAGSVTVADGVLEIQDASGCTVWWRERLTAPVEIRYTATVVMEGGPHDRLSDLNCFWMASDPRHPDDLFAPGHGRTGAFADYDGLQTYYVGYGGNENTTTRFRRYQGDGNKPLLPEHDLREAKFLLEPNRPYQIRLVALPDGTTRYYRDGELLFDYRDPEPLRTGWFGFRTVSSHLRITDLTIGRPD